MSMKRVWRRCAAALMLMLALAISASAVTDEVTYELTRDGSRVSLERTTADTAFWEAPSLSAGQTRTGGRLTLHNNTDRTAVFTLREIELPYDLEEALRYLDAVNVVIKDAESGAVYYSGRYSHIADNRAPEVRLEVPAGGSHTLEMAISCAYAYKSNVPASRSIVWTFGAELQSASPSKTTKAGADDAPPTWSELFWLYVVLVVGILLLLGVIAWLLHKLRELDRHKKK